MDVVELEDLSGGELLDHAEVLGATQRRCEVEIFQVAVQHAYLHHADGLDRAESAKPGREMARRPGREGTPEVSDFAAAELGARLEMSTAATSVTACPGSGAGSRPVRCGCVWRGWWRGRPAT